METVPPNAVEEVKRLAQKKYAREGYLEENYHYFHLRDSAGAERDFHFHEFDKLVLLLSGHVDYAMESIVYTLRPWDILLVPHHTIHKALIDKSAPYERIILYLDRKYFDRLMPDARLFGCFDRADERARYLLAPDEAQRAPLETLLGQLEEALRGGQFGAEAMCDALIVQLLVLLGRLGFSDAADEQTPAVLESKYAVGKYWSELFVNTLFQGIRHTNLRMASLIGAGFDQRITNKFAKSNIVGYAVANCYTYTHAQAYGNSDA